MVVRIAAARMIARWARSPSSPAPAARRCAALGLDRSTRPNKQERPTIYSKHDELKALRSLDRLIESSKIEASDVTIKPRAPLLIVDQAPARAADANHLPVFLAPTKATSLNVERQCTGRLPRRCYGQQWSPFSQWHCA